MGLTNKLKQETLGTMSRPKLHPKLPKYVVSDPDRHGNQRYYFRAPGCPKVRLTETPGTKAFEDEVACARLGMPYKQEVERAPAPRIDTSQPAKGSLRWLVVEYKRRAHGTVTDRTMATRVKILEEICKSGVKRKRGELPYAKLERKHVVEIRDDLRETPGARNDIVKALSAMFHWALGAGLVRANPCSGISRLKSGDGFHTWTEEEVLAYEAVHAEGSSARLALQLALFTGLRIAELAIVGRQHVRDGWLTIRPSKTSRSSKVVVEIPVLPELQRAISEGPVGNMTFLVNERGKPFSTKGLGNRMRKWCDKAQLFHCSMHGLRKAGAVRAAESGATENQLMAIFGWTTMEQATLYTQKANRKRMAQKGIRHLGREQTGDEFVPPSGGMEKSETKSSGRSSKNKG